MSTFRPLINNITTVCILFSIGLTFAEETDTQKTEPSPFNQGSWTVIVLPDTQHYVSPKNMEVEKKHPILDCMMAWIAGVRDTRNVRMVVHVGDMTNSNTVPIPRFTYIWVPWL